MRRTPRWCCPLHRLLSALPWLICISMKPAWALTSPGDAPSANAILPESPTDSPSQSAVARATHGSQGMAMPDMGPFYRVLADQIEYTAGQGDAVAAWDVDAYIGGDINRLLLRTEGERGRHGGDGRVEMSGSRAVAPYWDTQIGLRHDFGAGPARQWLLLGVSGTAPYWIQTRAAVYLGTSGRAAFYGQLEYDARLTQCMILTPEVEGNLYSRADPARGLGAGLSDLNLGLRLRYEFSPRFAPYLGVGLQSRFGATAANARREDEHALAVRVLLGVRLWF